MAMPPDPLRLAKASHADRLAFVAQAVAADPVAVRVLEIARSLDLPDHALMAGAVYKAVWNALTGRPPGFGVNDYDLAYFDGSDLSWEAEGRVIRNARPAFADTGVEVEVCNQARVHIWFSAKFGIDRAPLQDTEDALRHFASLSHAVAVRMNASGGLDVLAPLGLDELFSLHVRPCPGLADPAGWNAKCEIQAVLWPELTFELLALE